MYDQKKPPTSERILPILGRSGIEPLLDSLTAAALPLVQRTGRARR